MTTYFIVATQQQDKKIDRPSSNTGRIHLASRSSKSTASLHLGENEKGGPNVWLYLQHRCPDLPHLVENVEIVDCLHENDRKGTATALCPDTHVFPC